MKRKLSARAKLEPATARRAMRLWLGGMPQAEVARRVGVSQAAISMLVRGKTYREATVGLRKSA